MYASVRARLCMFGNGEDGKHMISLVFLPLVALTENVDSFHLYLFGGKGKGGNKSAPMNSKIALKCAL